MLPAVFPPARVAVYRLWLAALLVLVVQPTTALEVLSVHELVGHCKNLNKNPQSADGQLCIRYIQGFVDGAVETDERIVRGMDDSTSLTPIMERAMRTRLPARGAYDRPGSLAGFCLSDPVPWGEVVDTIVQDLIAVDLDQGAGSPARVAVDDALRQHFPCTE